MGRKLYVGNLPYSVDENALKELFAEAGTVESVKIVTDPYNGRSKGFGFVEMATDEEAKTATETVNGKEIEGRAIKVDEARPRQDKKRPRGGPPRGNRW